MQLSQFEYVEPKSLEEAARFMQEKGPECMLIGGGTDILPSMKQRIFNDWRTVPYRSRLVPVVEP